MAKYVIIQPKDGSYCYASKKLFGIFNIGIAGYVGAVGRTVEECEKDLIKVLNRGEDKVLKEIEIQ